MIKPEDLRKGNYADEMNRSNKVHLPYYHTWEIASIEIGGVKVINPGENICHIEKPHFIEYPDLVEIPLTEQWLKDFGFKECENFQFRIKLDGIKRGLVISVKWSKSFLDNVYLNQLTEIKYVHQLQNLFYCLTGKELTKQ